MTGSTVQVTTLPSGLRVATDHMAHVETAAIGVWVDAGTRDEPIEINGIAHLLEHMAFKGTRRRSARDIAEEIEAVGGHVNAYTSRETTAYYLRVMKENVALAVDILADILQESTFEETELARERAVVLQEIGQAFDTPDDIIFDHFQETAYPDQSMGWPVLGRADVVEKMPRTALIDYMAGNYAPSRMVVAAAGHIDHDVLVELASRMFTGLTGKAGKPRSPAVYSGGDYREARDLEQVHLVLGLPGAAYGSDDYTATSVLSTVLGGGMSSRLFQTVREERGLAYSIYSFHSAYRDGGVFGIYAGTGEDQLIELVDVLAEELKGAAASIGQQELDRAKTQLRSSLRMSRESTGARCEQLANQLIVYGRPMPPEETIARIDGVETRTIQRIAGDTLSGPLTVAGLGPVAKLDEHGAIAARLS